MAIASANRASIAVADESTFGTPSTGTFQALRMTDDSITPQFNTGESGLIRSDRMLDDRPLLTIGAGGDLGGEGWYGTDIATLLPYFFFSSFTAADTTAISLDVDRTGASANQTNIDRATGSFVTDGFAAGYWVKLTGFTNAVNNVVRRISSVTALQIVLEDPDESMTNETGGGDERVRQNGMRNGTTDKQLTIEKNWADISQFIHFSGMKGNTLEYDITAAELITGRMNFLGSQAITGQTSGSTDAAPSGDSMTASSSVGQIERNGATLSTALRRVQFSLNNNLQQTYKIASQFAADITLGTVQVEGTVEAYFEDLTLYNDALNQSDVGLSFRMFDTSGNSIVWTFDRVRFGDAGIPTPGKDQPLVVNLPFSALRYSTHNAAIQVDYLSATA